MHSNGFHKLAVVFCGCANDLGSLSYQNQLLRICLFPATTDNPKTAFTFSSLDLLAQLSTQGKISTYNFYISLRNLTDPLDLMNWPVSYKLFHLNYFLTHALFQKRYDELSRVIRRYKHLLLLKRSGRGNVANGITTTSDGQLAIECPACPHPGRNMPENWQATKP
jgi:hypothetical protein